MASERLHIAQPAISRQILALEDELGVRLFTRTRKGVQLTGAGSFFLERTLPFLIELKQAKDVLVRQSEANVGDVVIGLTTGEGLTVASTLIDRWRETFPASHLRIVEGLAPLIYSGLKDQSIALGIAPEPLEFPSIWTRPLFREPLVFIASRRQAPSLPAVDEDVIYDVRRVLELPLLAPSFPNPLRTSIENMAEKYGVKANISNEIDSMSIIKDLVRRGIGYALTTHAHLGNEAEHDMLRIIPVETEECWRNVSLFGLEGAQAPDRNSRTADFLHDLVIESVAAGAWPGAKLIPAA